MEHKVILGGKQLLPFARSRIKALRALGLEYADQKFEVPGLGTAYVKIMPGQDYITLRGTDHVTVFPYFHQYPENFYPELPDGLIRLSGASGVKAYAGTYTEQPDYLNSTDAAWQDHLLTGVSTLDSDFATTPFSDLRLRATSLLRESSFAGVWFSTRDQSFYVSASGGSPDDVLRLEGLNSSDTSDTRAYSGVTVCSADLAVLPVFVDRYAESQITSGGTVTSATRSGTVSATLMTLHNGEQGPLLRSIALTDQAYTQGYTSADGASQVNYPLGAKAVVCRNGAIFLLRLFGTIPVGALACPVRALVDFVDPYGVLHQAVIDLPAGLATRSAGSALMPVELVSLFDLIPDADGRRVFLHYSDAYDSHTLLEFAIKKTVVDGGDNTYTFTALAPRLWTSPPRSFTTPNEPKALWSPAQCVKGYIWSSIACYIVETNTFVFLGTFRRSTLDGTPGDDPSTEGSATAPLILLDPASPNSLAFAETPTYLQVSDDGRTATYYFLRPRHSAMGKYITVMRYRLVKNTLTGLDEVVFRGGKELRDADSLDDARAVICPNGEEGSTRDRLPAHFVEAPTAVLRFRKPSGHPPQQPKP